MVLFFFFFLTGVVLSSQIVFILCLTDVISIQPFLSYISLV